MSSIIKVWRVGAAAWTASSKASAILAPAAGPEAGGTNEMSAVDDAAIILALNRLAHVHR
jgi:hypothetical protein